MEQIKKCKYCESENLYLAPKNEGEDPLTANTVAIKCKDCGKWLAWCPKADRKLYAKNAQNSVETQKVEQVIKEEKKSEILPKKEPKVKEIILDFILEQRNIVISGFATERNKAVAILDKISRFIAQKL